MIMETTQACDLSCRHCRAEARADQLYSVHGDSTFDPTEPPHSKPYPFPPVPTNLQFNDCRMDFQDRGYRLNARRLITDQTGRRIDAVELDRDGEHLRLSANLFVVSCGAINSALLLLRSRSDRHPNGLANSSGQVGRNLMTHNGGMIFCFDLLHSNRDKFQKTLGLNDFYLKGRTGIIQWEPCSSGENCLHILSKNFRDLRITER